MITLEEAKAYLRVDSSMEDSLIESLLQSAEKLTADVGRITAEEWNTLWDDETETMTIRDEDISNESLVQLRSLLHTAMLFTLGYLYEHREEADHHALVMTYLGSVLYIPAATIGVIIFIARIWDPQ